MIPIRKGSLRDYTDEELQNFLQNNNTLPADFLKFIISEFLRRKLDDKK